MGRRNESGKQTDSVKPTELESYRFGSMCQASVHLSLPCLLVPTTSAEQLHSYVITSPKYTLLLAALCLAQTKNASERTSSKAASCKLYGFPQDALVSPLKAPFLPPAQQNAVAGGTLRDALVVGDLMEGSIPYRPTDAGNHGPPAVHRQQLRVMASTFGGRPRQRPLTPLL